MSDIHITRELLRAVTRGELPPRVLVESVWKHLLRLCPTCDQEYRAWQDEEKSPPDYASTLKVIPLVLTRHRKDEKQARRKADREAKTLMGLPLKARLAKIRRSYRRFRGPLLAQQLLEESKRQMTMDPTLAEELAETAEAVLVQTPAHPDLPGLKTLSVVYRANVARLRGQPDVARAQFARARAIIRLEGVTDLLICGEADSCEAVLALELRRFSEAEELLKRSVALYLLAGAREKAAHPLVTMGHLYNDSGNPDQAVEMTHAALEVMDAEAEPRLHVYAHLNIALFLHEAGRHSEAAEALAEAKERSQRFPDAYTQIRIQWLEGRLAATSGDLAEAERIFLAVREDLVLRNQRYDAAMVSMDLALLYLRQDRTGELMRIAEEMHTLFSVEEVHREAMASLLVFQEAARKEELTVEVIQRFATVLKKLRN